MDHLKPLAEFVMEQVKFGERSEGQTLSLSSKYSSAQHGTWKKIVCETYKLKNIVCHRNVESEGDGKAGDN